MKGAHLSAGLAALALLALILAAGEAVAGRIENRYVHSLSIFDFPQRRAGSALQREAFRQADLLTVYGSSELTLPDPYHANRVFRLYPTGFTTFTVGGNGSEPINILQALAAIGTDLHGRKVAISLSPDFFLGSMAPLSAYAANFSWLHAYAFAFNPELDWDLKQAVARRMLDYPPTLARDPLLNFSLHTLADGSLPSRALYYLILPIGELKLETLNLQDHWETLSYIESLGDVDTTVVKKPSVLRWPSLLARAKARYEAISNNNPFGYENSQWLHLSAHWLEHKNIMTDQQFLAELHSSYGWTDLDLLLQELKQLDAEPLLLSIPFSGSYYDFMGTSRGARQQYYDRLEAVAAEYGVKVVDFQDHEQDLDFFLNPASHLSSVGWIYYAATLDMFYHGEEGSLRPQGVEIVQ